MSLIPQHFIDECLARSDIVELVGERVKLRKAGSNFQGLCPFHQEKSPSFSVSQQKQFYHCFGCGAHGNAIGFIMAFDNLPFRDAVETLADRCNLPMPQDDGPSAPSSQHLYELMEQISHFYQQQWRTPNASAAVEYLKARGLSGKLAKDFGLGFAPDGWDNLTQALPDAKLEDLMQVGMLIEKNAQRHYDRFRNRIMFPIHDHRGRIIGFGGRVLTKDEQPKYLNSPETVIFQKGKELYGFFEAKQAAKQSDSIIVVEGYMDVLALAQHGFENVVATLGTSTTPQHIKQLYRWVNHIVCCFDGDRAGKDAAWRALTHLLAQAKDGQKASFIFLPEGEDPDSLVRTNGTEAFQKLIENSVSLSDFFFQHLLAEHPIGSLDEKASFAKVAMTHIEGMPRSLFKQMMIEQLSQMVNIDASQLTDEPPPPPTTNTARKNFSMKKSKPLRTIITIMLQHPELASQCQISPQILSLDIPGMNILKDLLNKIQHNTGITTGRLLESWRDTDLFSTLDKLAILDLQIPQSGLGEELQGAVTRLESQLTEQTIQALMDKMKLNAISDEERKTLHELLQQKAVQS